MRAVVCTMALLLMTVLHTHAVYYCIGIIKHRYFPDVVNTH